MMQCKLQMLVPKLMVFNLTTMNTSFVQEPLNSHCCHTGTAIKHPVPDWIRLDCAVFYVPSNTV